jgi:D-erythronate 2-dehydrogenase
MASVVITGGSGFLGARLAADLLTAGSIDPAGDGLRRIARLTLIDRAPAPPRLTADRRVTAITGDLADLLDPAAGESGVRAALAEAQVIFHLAAAVSAQCEADFDLGMRANLLATELLLATCRALGSNPVVVFASSVAVFGATARHPLPGVVEDDTWPRPQSSYGTQKLVSEYLLADYTRKGFLRGRAVRLMTVVVRKGQPNAAASAFLSAIIRAPLAGQRAICPVAPATEVAIASPARAIEGLMCAATSPEATWGERTAVNLPSLSVTVGEMISALGRAAGPAATGLIDWAPDPAVARIMTSWPARFRTDRAARLGLAPDPDIDSIIALYLAETGSTTI